MAAYTKSRLIRELAYKAGITQRQSRAMLEALAEIACREARNVFVLPGLCKFEIVRRRARTVRNPATGETMFLPERDALRVVASKRAKAAAVEQVVTAKPLSAVQPPPAPQPEAASAPAPTAPVPEAATPAPEAAAPAPVVPAPETAAPAPEAAAPAPVVPAPETAAPAPEAATPAPAPAAESAQTSSAAELPSLAEAVKDAAAKAEANDGFIEVPQGSGENSISFRCTTCGQEIVAPGDAAGYEAECPACGAVLIVPARSETGTMCANGGAAEKEVISVEQAENLDPTALKNRTIRIDTMLFADAAETNSSPSKANFGTTMRIDLPDEF